VLARWCAASWWGPACWLVTCGLSPLHLPIRWILFFALMGGAILGSLGVIAGIWADKFDQLAAFQNFVIMPLTFLSGVFYSIHSLPVFWQEVSHFNPVFYMIDGFRYGFFGVSPMCRRLSLAVVGGCLAGAHRISR
jgi:ABC-2 type transport system permease protein